MEHGPIDLCFSGSRVCWSTVLHCCLAYLKVFGKGGYVRLGPRSQPNITPLNQTILNLT